MSISGVFSYATTFSRPKVTVAGGQTEGDYCSRWVHGGDMEM